MKKHILLAVILLTLPISARCDYWTQKADFGGLGRGDAACFSILNKGYVGTGFTTVYTGDWWEYNVQSNSWVQKASVPGSYVETSFFSIGTKGYLLSYPGGVDFWQFDPVANTWTQMAAFPGPPRQAAVGFAINGMGYITTGLTNSTNLNDNWQYNPTTNSWLQKASLPGNSRHYASGFSVGNYGYVTTGVDSNYTYLNDLWQYDAVNDSWAAKANFPGAARIEASAFSIGTKGYVGCGSSSGNYFQNFFMYDPATNTWTQKANFGGNGREEAVQFSIGNLGYLGTGYDGVQPGVSRRDFWEYHPEDSLTSVSEITSHETQIMLQPNPFNSSTQVSFNYSGSEKLSLIVYDMTGKKVRQESISGSGSIFERNQLSPGEYLMEIIAGNNLIAKKKIIVAKE